MSNFSIAKILIATRTGAECDAAINYGTIAHGEAGDHFLEVLPILEEPEGAPGWLVELANAAESEGAEYILVHP